jgi:hypothetical protein
MKPDYSLPEDSFQQGGRGLKNSVYASSMGQYPAPYAMGGAMNQYPDGGSIYTYAKRPGSYYQKDSEGNWLISNKGTGGQYVPVEDPSGQRTAALNKGAVVTMANPTASKYDNVTPSYGKSPMIQSVAGRTEAERQPVQDAIAGQQFAQNMEQDYAAATKDQLPQHEQPVDMMDYAWQAGALAPSILPAAIKGAGMLGAKAMPYITEALGTSIPGMSAVPGATVGNALGAYSIVQGGKKLSKVPEQIQQGEYADALENTLTGAFDVGTAGVVSPLYKGAKATVNEFGKLLGTEEGLLSNTYKLNPWATKLNTYNRVVGDDAIADLQNSGLVRSGDLGGVSTNLGKRTTPYPSFGKGNPRQAYIDQTMQQDKTPFIISTNRSMKASNLGRHGKGSTMFPIDETGAYMTSFPADEVKVFQNKPNWLNGYQEVPVKMNNNIETGFFNGLSNPEIPQINPRTGLMQINNTTLLSTPLPVKIKEVDIPNFKSAEGLPEDQVPYLLPQSEVMIRKPWLYQGKDDMIMESFKSNNKIAERPYEIPASHNTQEDIMARALSKPLPTRVSKASLEPKVYYDLDGNIIDKPYAFGGQLNYQYPNGGVLETASDLVPTTPVPEGPVIPGEQDIRDFYTNWYSKRTLPFDEIGNKQYEKTMKSILPAYNPESTLLNEINANKVPYEIVPTLDGGSAQGAIVYNKKGLPEKIQLSESIMNNPRELNATMMHEGRTRIMAPYADEVYSAEQKIIGPSIKSFDEIGKDIKDSEERDAAGDYYDYLTSPQEDNIQSMLFEIRQQKNLQPNQTITDEDIENWRLEGEKSGELDRNSPNFNGALYNLFKVSKDNSSMKNLFNYIASDNTPKSNNMNMFPTYGGNFV